MPVLFSMLIFSCIDRESPEGIDSDKNEITLYFRSSGSPHTRALNDSLESIVEHIDVLAFEAWSTNAFFAYRRSIDKDEITTDANDYSIKKFKITVPKDAKTYKYAILANARSEVEAVFANNEHIGEGMEQIYSGIISSEPNYWNVEPSNYRRIPLWGESEGVKTVAELDNSIIQLYRSLAAIDISIEPTAGFKLKEIYIFNRPTKGRVAPDKARFDAINNRFKSPTLPVPFDITDKITTNSPGTPLIKSNSEIVELKNTIFMYETEKHDSENYLLATCLVLGGNVNNKATMSYYRVDFADYKPPIGGTTPPDWNTGPPTTGSGDGGSVGSGDIYYPLLRNHRYEIKVAGTSGSGSSSPLFAAQAQGSHLITGFSTWNNHDENLYIDDTPYEFKISKTTVNLKTSNPAYISLSTTFPGRWSVGDETSSWFKCTVNGSAQNANVSVMLNGTPSAGDIGYFKIKLMDGAKEKLSQLVKVEYR
jgi:hypothetical protein